MIGLTEILAIQKLVDAGAVKMQYVPTDHDGNCEYKFMAWDHPRVEFVFFNDAGDWDYLAFVLVDGLIVANWELMHNTTESDWKENWRDVGKWMPDLPNYMELS